MRYRADIDGLRGLAVVLVIAYHYGLTQLAGGYIGVDVFFVISGFLITTIILNDSNFSIWRFYERRARRILPALFVVIAASAAAATVWFIPNDLTAFAESAAATIFFGSNFLFQSQAGYFDASADLKPLLHTWSLAVEEQFYILHPIFLLMLLKSGKPWAVGGGLAAVLGVSLLVSAITVHTDPSAAFFLLPARAWELCAGALLAVWRLPSSGRFSTCGWRAGPSPDPRSCGAVHRRDTVPWHLLRWRRSSARFC